MAEVIEKEKVAQMEKEGQWWWLAEKKRSRRLDYLRKAYWVKGVKGIAHLPGVKVDLEKARWNTKVFQETEGEPLTVRVAKALAAVLDNTPIFITDHSQIVGHVGSYPHTIVWNQDAAFFLNEEVYGDRTVIPEPEEESLREIREICNYWNPRCELAGQAMLLSPEDMMKLATGMITVGFPVFGRIGYATKQYSFFFRLGFNGIMKMIDAKIVEAEQRVHGAKVPDPEDLKFVYKLDNWKAMKITLEAGIRWARRYSRLAKIVAENFETEPQRRKELLRISETCYKVPAEPPQHLWESLQFEHFMQTIAHYESTEAAYPCRPDYYHWPYYERDVIEEKNLTREEVLDLLGEMSIRTMEYGWYIPQTMKESAQGGITGTWIWTIGGVDEEGEDACNDLTDAWLEAARLVRVPGPSYAFRYHPKARVQTLRQVFQCIKEGLGYPSIRNDPILIQNGMYWHGHPLKEMRQWVHMGCLSPNPPTKWGASPCRMAMATIIASKAMEWALFDGWDPVLKMQMGPHTGDTAKFTDFEELYQAWYEQIKYLMGLAARFVNIGRYAAEGIAPRPFLSAISERSVDLGVDVLNPSDRGNSWITFFAWADTPDALAAAKKLVFDDKKYTMAELLEALKANWEGYAEMRMDFVRAPKWGNDDDYVDQVHVRCYKDIAKYSREIRDPMGNTWPILPENISAYVGNSMKVGALPNGRRMGDTLYDGGCSPGAGLDKKGPTAVLRSVSKIDHVTDCRATLLNQRLSVAQLQGEKGFGLWLSYIKTWSDLEIDHVQFNCVDNETLRAAQREPEKYTELIVRIAGYSAHFVDLSKKTQDTIIARNVQQI